MQKKIILYMVGFMMTSLFTSCKDDPESQLIPSTTQLTFSSNGGTQTLGIESNTGWRIVSNVNWLSAYPSKGSNSQSVTITASVKDNQLEQESKLIIATDDGQKIVNVSVKIEGSSVKTGKHLEVRVDEKTFSGKSGAVDSIEITSNVTWEVLGPEWLEAWDGGRWRPLSETRGVVKGEGKQSVFVRTASDNKNEKSLDNIIIIREYLTGELSNSINVRQVGRMQVSPTVLWNLEDGIAFDWHCGCDVAKIYFKVTDNKNEDSSIDAMRSSYDVTDESYINSATGLKPGSMFYIIAAGEDVNGNIDNHYYTTFGNLPQEALPVAGISSGIHTESGQWRFLIATNMLTAKFHIHVTDKSNSAFMYNDPILWHIAITNLNKKYWFQEGTGYLTPGWLFWNNLSGSTNEIHAMALAYAEVGGQARPKVFRYDRYYDSDGKRLPDKPLLDRIPKAMVDDPSLR